MGLTPGAELESSGTREMKGETSSYANCVVSGVGYACRLVVASNLRV